MAADEDDGEVVGNPVPMLGPQRVLLAVAGLIAFAAGVVAVFFGPNDLGSVSLVAVGGVLLTLAILGLMPRQLTMGPLGVTTFAEARAQGAAEVVEVVRAVSGPEAAREVAEAVAEITPDPAPAIRFDYRAVRLYEREVEAAVEKLVPPGTAVEREVRLESPLGRAFGLKVDVALLLNGRRAYVDVTYQHPQQAQRMNTQYLFRRVADRLISGLHVHGGYWVVVTNGPVPDFRAIDGLLAVEWRSSVDDQVLAGVLRTALQGDGEAT